MSIGTAASGFDTAASLASAFGFLGGHYGTSDAYTNLNTVLSDLGHQGSDELHYMAVGLRIAANVYEGTEQNVSDLAAVAGQEIDPQAVKKAWKG